MRVLHSNETTMKSSPHELQEMIHHAILYALMATMPVCCYLVYLGLMMMQEFQVAMHENNAILSALRRRTLKHGGALGAWVHCRTDQAHGGIGFRCWSISRRIIRMRGWILESGLGLCMGGMPVVPGGVGHECMTTAEIGPRGLQPSGKGPPRWHAGCWRRGMGCTGIEDYWYEICSVAAHEHGKGGGEGGMSCITAWQLRLHCVGEDWMHLYQDGAG